MNRLLSTTIFLLSIIASSCDPQKATTATDNNKGLKDYYKDYFPIGVAVAPRNLAGDEAQLILQQFNSITPENAMKMGPIHPEENRYN